MPTTLEPLVNFLTAKIPITVPSTWAWFALSKEASVMLVMAVETEPVPDARSLAAERTPEPSKIESAPTPLTKFMLVVLAMISVKQLPLYNLMGFQFRFNTRTLLSVCYGR